MGREGDLLSGLFRIFQYGAAHHWWVSLCTAALTGLTAAVLGLSGAFLPALLVLASSLVIYGLDDLLDGEGRRGMTAQVGIAAASVAVLLFIAPASVRWLVGVGLAICATYALPLGRDRQGKVWRPKRLPGLKAWWVAGAVTVAVTLVPLAWVGTPHGSPDQLPQLLLFLFLFTFTNVTAFDVRDVLEDRERQVGTMPVMLGVEPTRATLLTLQLLLLGGLVALWTSGVQQFRWELLAGTLWVLAYLRLLDPRAARWQYDLAVDGSLLGVGLLAVVLRAL